MRSLAYADQPLKSGNIHLSAPHIYCSILEALDLRPNSSLSFLNIGFGTGYLSCIAAEILGPNAIHYGVEIHEDVIQHSKTSIDNWIRRQKSKSDSNVSSTNKKPSSFPLKIFHGNGLNISSGSGEGLQGFDRIYVGGGINSLQLEMVKSLMCTGGILVAPVEDKLVKFTRLAPGPGTDTTFLFDFISSVRFASLKKSPSTSTVIPALIWDPFLYNFCPPSFQKSVTTLLMCSNSQTIQPLKQKESHPINVSSMLPREIWVYILSFTSRKWFEPQEPEADRLRRQLLFERKKSIQAKEAAADAQVSCRQAENQRDFYRDLAERMYTCLQSVTQYNENINHLQRQNVNNTVMPPEFLQSTQNLLNEINWNRRHIQNGNFPRHRYDGDWTLAEDELSSEIDDEMVLDELNSDDNLSIFAIDDDNSASSEMSMESHGNEDVSVPTDDPNVIRTYSRQQPRSVSISEDI